MVRALVPPGHWPDARPLPGRTLPDVWARRWADRPGAPALVDGWGGESVDGAELDRRTAQAASVLAERGVRPGDRVLWRARATIESVGALVATLRAGAVLVPVSPSARAGEVAHVVSDARPVLAICPGRPVPPDRQRAGPFERARAGQQLAMPLIGDI